MTAKDPVCGMTVELDAGKPSREHKGETYHFCSQKCHDKFAADPSHYLSGGHKRESKAQPKGTKYTCPMHTEIVRDAPGDCPICGMALEPMGVPAADEGPNPELVDFTRRFWVAAALTVPLLILTMPPYLGYNQIRELFGEWTSLWIEVVIGSPVILWSGWPFFVRGYKSFRTMNLNMFSLIAMGVGADVAIESAGFTLVKGNLDGIVRARRLARATMRNIKQNLFFALIYNAAGVPIAAGILYPFFGILIGPIFAAFAMSASSLSVVMNSLRLRSVKI